MIFLFPDYGPYHRLLRQETLPVPAQPGKIMRRYTTYCGFRKGDIGWYRTDLRPEQQPYCQECYQLGEG